MSCLSTSQKFLSTRICCLPWSQGRVPAKQILIMHFSMDPVLKAYVMLDSHPCHPSGWVCWHGPVRALDRGLEPGPHRADQGLAWHFRRHFTSNHRQCTRTSDHTMNVPRVMVRGPLRHSYVAIRSTCAGRGSAQSEHRGPCNLLSPGNARVNLIGTASTAYLRSPVFPVQPAPGIWDAQGVATGQGLTGLSIWVFSAHRGRSGMKISNTGRRRSSSNEPVVRAAGRQARFGGNAVQNMVWRTASTGSMPGMLSGS